MAFWATSRKRRCGLICTSTPSLSRCPPRPHSYGQIPCLCGIPRPCPPDVRKHRLLTMSLFSKENGFLVSLPRHLHCTCRIRFHFGHQPQWLHRLRSPCTRSIVSVITSLSYCTSEATCIRKQIAIASANTGLLGLRRREIEM